MTTDSDWMDALANQISIDPRTGIVWCQALESNWKVHRDGEIAIVYNWKTGVPMKICIPKPDNDLQLKLSIATSYQFRNWAKRKGA